LKAESSILLRYGRVTAEEESRETKQEQVRKNNFQTLEPMFANRSQTISDVWYS
jgi:hypothetical protein